MRRQLTQAERGTFDAIRDPAYDNFILVEVTFNGIEATAIATQEKHGYDGVIFTPVALLVNDEISALITGPTMDE